MKQCLAMIDHNLPLTDAMFEMILSSVNTDSIQPGQFINVQIPGLFLRRPISVCDVSEHKVKIAYKVVGKGTGQMSQMKPGETLDILYELGNGYDLSCAGDKPLLVGGGAGVPPMVYLARMLKEQGKEVTVILGFNTASEKFYEHEFKDLGVNLIVTTADGSYGIKGFVSDALPETYTHFYACGPFPMMKALYRKTTTAGQFSLEERMGCGFGACMGCSIETKSGNKRVCKEGPVFRKEDLSWDD